MWDIFRTASAEKDYMNEDQKWQLVHFHSMIIILSGIKLGTVGKEWVHLLLAFNMQHYFCLFLMQKLMSRVNVRKIFWELFHIVPKIILIQNVVTRF